MLSQQIALIFAQNIMMCTGIVAYSIHSIVLCIVLVHSKDTGSLNLLGQIFFINLWQTVLRH